MLNIKKKNIHTYKSVFYFSSFQSAFSIFSIIFAKYKFDYVIFLLKNQDSYSVPTFLGKTQNMANDDFTPLVLTHLPWHFQSYIHNLIHN